GRHYVREVVFYSSVAPRSCIALPRCYDSCFDEAGDRFHLLLEDCFHGHSTCGFEPGPSIAVLFQAVVWLAAFQAQWWNRPDLIGPLAQLPTPWAGPISDGEGLRQFFDLARDHMSDRERRVCTLVFQHWSSLQDRSSKELTLRHGDFHPLNMFVPMTPHDHFLVVDCQFCA